MRRKNQSRSGSNIARSPQGPPDGPLRSPAARPDKPASRPHASPLSLLGTGRIGSGFPALPIACFTLFFLYVGLRIEPAVQFFSSGPVFYLSRSFLNRFLTRPGGLLEYAAAMLAQLDASNWLGALTFTTLAGLLFLGTRRWLQVFTGATFNLAPFIPVFLLLLLRERAEASFLVSGLGVLAALGAALGYVLLPARLDQSSVPSSLASAKEEAERAAPLRPPSVAANAPACSSGESAPSRLSKPGFGFWLSALGFSASPAGRLGLCCLNSALLFYVAGPWPCLLWAALAGLWECKRHRQWLLGIACFLSGGVALLWLLCCAAHPAKPWLPGKPVLAILLMAALFLYLPLTSVALWLLCRPGRTTLSQPSAFPAKAPCSSRHQRALAVGLFLLAGAAVWLALDAQRQALARIDYYASQREDEQVLRAATAAKVLTPGAEIRLHLALAHTGRLCQDLFAFTNQTTWRLLPSLGAGLEACRAQSHTLLELGQVSEAEHLAHESLEWEGERPDTLRLLAQVNILKDRPQAARVFLHVLHQVPTQRAWAGNYLRQLAANPRLPDDKELAQIRTRMVKTDLPHIDIPVETFMRQLLHANPRNRMAFDYLMAHYLLTLETGKLVDRLKELNDFGYTSLPRHLEEAILLHQQLKRGQVDLCGHKIRPETLERFQQWSEAIRQGKFMSLQGREELTRHFGDTYWYYFLARQGAGTASNS